MRLEQNSRPGSGPSNASERFQELPQAGIPAARFDELDDIEMTEYLELFARVGELPANAPRPVLAADDPFHYIS